MILILLFALNISFMGAVWHMSSNHILEGFGQELTGGIFRVTPETGFRLSEYWVIGTLFLMDVLFVVSFFMKKNEKEKKMFEEKKEIQTKKQ